MAAFWRLLFCHFLVAAFLFDSAASHSQEPPATFFRGLNLNGPTALIDGKIWEGADAPWYSSVDKAFENQSIQLIPATDPERAKMIRSSRWGGNRIVISDLPDVELTLFLYVWEDSNSETFSIFLDDRLVQHDFQSGRAGSWKKLGPWMTRPSGGKLTLSSRGGAANFSGIEIWKGRHDGIEAEPTLDELAFFESKIRPLLIDNCYSCHSQESDELEGDFLIDSRFTLRRGGVHGPGVVPGDPANSSLIRAVKYADESLQMPPGEQLTPEQIADLERWVAMGAPDPRAEVTRHAGKKIDVQSARQFWSFQPITNPTVPSVQNAKWPRNDIDYFILAKLEEKGLQPAQDADRRSWIRRVTYDLTGLPPQPEDVQAFLSDNSDSAFETVVDRLLSSPRYGQRWGRHWLDVVRYADTAGDNSDYPIPQIYRYRDWVIDAFNADLPYDEFVRDQLSGDLRGGDSQQVRQQRLIATGYIANSRRFGSRVDDYPQHLTIEDTLDNVGRAFLGLSLSCARCHDHKFDPITTHDYYGLYGIFSSTRYPWPGIELDKRQRDFVPLAPMSEWERLKQAQAQAQRDALQKELDNRVKELAAQLKEPQNQSNEQLKVEHTKAKRAAREHADQPPLFETAYAVADSQQLAGVSVLIKGDPTRQGDLVPRRFLTIFGGLEVDPAANESGRRELAEWLLADWNPLTTRVIANRIWHYHFGRGIVPTPNDFGLQGKPPTHPELLDFLAQQMRQQGWSMKALHRSILLSRTYQQSAIRPDRSVEIDPSNEFLSGFPQRRLDAESMRDTLLVLAGNLDDSPAGPHPFPAEHTWGFTQHNPFKANYETNRRSVYLMTQRIQRHPYLAMFDGADPSASTATRLTSTTPLQALFLLNDPFVHQQANLIAARFHQDQYSLDERIDHTYLAMFSRPANTEEKIAAKQFLDQIKDASLAEDQSQEKTREQAELSAWQAYVRVLLRLNEFVYID